jgi:uncharacterized membrane protein YfcA
MLDSTTPALLAIYAAAATAAGFIDTLAGGGGLITVPALLLGGMPPLQVLGTNKLQGVFGTLVASVSLVAKSKFGLRDLVFPFAMVFGGGAAGALLVQLVNTKLLDAIVPVVLSAIALYFLFAPGVGSVDRRPRIGHRLYCTCILPVIGFYDGFFGPGTGSFFSLSGVSLRGWELVRATASAKIFNLAPAWHPLPYSSTAAKSPGSSAVS